MASRTGVRLVCIWAAQRVFAEQFAGQQRKINDLPPHLAVHRIAAVHFGAHWLRHGGSLALRAAAVYAYK